MSVRVRKPYRIVKPNTVTLAKNENPVQASKRKREQKDSSTESSDAGTAP